MGHFVKGTCNEHGVVSLYNCFMRNERIQAIYSLLEEKSSISVEELAKELGVSKQTIRRDLIVMEDRRMLKRHYGGVSTNDNQSKEKSMHVKNLFYNDEKLKIARTAATLIKDNNVVYIDGGSTTAHIVDYIESRNILIITQAVNVIKHLVELNNKDFKCLTMGGHLKSSTNMLIDGKTFEDVRELYFDIAFIGANGIHDDIGFSATDDLEAKLKRTIIHNSNRSYVLADSSKFGKITNFKFANLSDSDLITDKLVSDFDYTKIPEVYWYQGDGLQHYKHHTLGKR